MIKCKDNMVVMMYSAEKENEHIQEGRPKKLSLTYSSGPAPMRWGIYDPLFRLSGPSPFGIKTRLGSCRSNNWQRTEE